MQINQSTNWKVLTKIVTWTVPKTVIKCDTLKPNKNSTTLFFPGFFHISRDTSVPRNTVWETPVQHVFVIVCSTKWSPISENRFVALGRTDRHDKSNGILSRMFCKTRLKIRVILNICKFLTSPQCFSLHPSTSRYQTKCYAQCWQPLATWRQHVSVSHHCAAWPCFYDLDKLQSCYSWMSWQNTTELHCRCSNCWTSF